MTVDFAVGLIPRTLINQIKDCEYFYRGLARYLAMEDDALFYVTEVYLRNLQPVEDDRPSLDRDLQLILVPELWERVRPGTRDKLRRLSSTLAEYNAEMALPTFFRPLLSPESRTRLHNGANDLRSRIKSVESLNVPALVEQVRFAIAGSCAADRWGPGANVYEPAFVYRLVPAIASRALNRSPSSAIEPKSKGPA